MIGYLRGRLQETNIDFAWIDVGGVGYEIFASKSTLDDLVLRLNQEVIVWTYTHVREDLLQLFGFSTREEKNLFLALLKVNGVGPKMALSLLSGARPAQIVEMVENSNAKGLSSLPKVGKKTAEQIILTLKGKLVFVENEKVSTNSSIQSEVASALLNLGFKSHAVEQFVTSLKPEIPLEEGVRMGLQILSGHN
ncbi:MAG: Holliday junction branch migration protein RuvA [Pseudobdellovibrionaceae bacterium]